MFTRSELVLLHHVANGINDVHSLSNVMSITPARVYDIIRSLKCNGILKDTRDIGLSSNASSLRLANLMRPSLERADVLADSGMDVLMEVRVPRTVEEIMGSLGLSRATVFRRLSLATASGAVRKVDGGRYVLNDRMWNGLRETLDSLEDQMEVFDPRVVDGAVIYRNRRDEVLFSFPGELDEQRTAFSIFREYGFESWFDTVYYTTSKSPVDISKAFNDAYLIAEKEGDHRLRMVLILFYLRNKSSIKANPDFLERFNRIRCGEKIDRWPTWDDVNTRIEEEVL